jgi:topoisomerase-4 subunit A
MPMSTFNKEAPKKFKDELEELTKETDKLMKVVKSPKKIDEIILEELGEMKKYARPRLCRIVNPADDQIISDRNHTIVITKQNYIKKLPEVLKRGVGALQQGDYVTRMFKCSNLNDLLLVDNTGRYSIVPVSEIPNSETSSIGTKIFDLCKLDGDIIDASWINPDDMEAISYEDKKSFVIITLSERGIIKKTPLTEFDFKSQSKNLRLCKLKEGDMLISSLLTVNSNNVLIVTQKGNYSYTSISDIPESSKDTQGVIGINVPDNDSCSSLCDIIPRACKAIVLITEKGKIKKLSSASLGSAKARRSTSYIAKVDPKDKIIYSAAFRDSNMGINILGSNGNNYTISVDEIPETSRISGFKKMIPVSSINKIIDIQIGTL